MSLVAHFFPLEDTRIDRKKLHGLIDIMVLSVCAIVSDAEGWQGIVEFGHEKLDWLRRFVPLKNEARRMGRAGAKPIKFGARINNLLGILFNAPFQVGWTAFFALHLLSRFWIFMLIN